MYTVILKRNEEKKVLNGFPWVYANEVYKIEGKDVQGNVAEVRSFDGKYIGKGFINHLSKILVRILTLKDEVIDEEFFKKRIITAKEFREELNYGNSYRAVFAESDFLPGLIVDRYGDYLSVQFLCLGMEIRKELIVNLLVEIFSPKGIYERSDVSVRLKEGLKEVKGKLYGEFNPKVLIEENGLKMYVDMENGQKTGYFLDQKENRDNLKRYVKGKTVLDCFCNVGGFSLCAAKYGAEKVVAVDISETAISSVKENAELNRLKIETVVADVFEKLREYRANKEKFGVVILDPPAFTKSAATVQGAIKGYRDINISGLKLVEKGGYLITCSCSQHLTIPLFLNMIEESVFQSGVNAKLVELRTQSRDHATVVGSNESLYLKVAVLKII